VGNDCFKAKCPGRAAAVVDAVQQLSLWIVLCKPQECDAVRYAHGTRSTFTELSRALIATQLPRLWCAKFYTVMMMERVENATGSKLHSYIL
jgi:hypothetical protein